MKDMILKALAFVQSAASFAGLTAVADLAGKLLANETLLDFFISLIGRYLPTPGEEAPTVMACSAEEQNAFHAAAIDVGQVIQLVQLIIGLIGQFRKKP